MMIFMDAVKANTPPDLQYRIFRHEDAHVVTLLGTKTRDGLRLSVSVAITDQELFNAKSIDALVKSRVDSAAASYRIVENDKERGQ